ncbi:alpha/beta hydrolase fold domain-containing protein [Rhodobacterales bacterium HKCCSP123]|nr:alpha/beta hydrolase fold domain-containing protein [Rhodobacterales bacterium HKCCSP123]
MARHLDRRALRLVAPQPVLRALFEVSARLGSVLPPDVTPIRDTRGALWFRPAAVARDAPVLLYLHGGGFTIGSPRTHAAMVAHMAKAAGLRAVIPRYRLAPAHPFPAARDDAIAAYARLVDEGTPPAAIAGDSAGGCLALQVLQQARDAGMPLPKATVLIGPIGDLSGDIASRFEAAGDEILIPPHWPARILRAYLPGVDRTDPAVSPLLGDLTGLPPTLIQAGAGEALAADARRLAEALDEATLELWEGLPHVWHLHAGRMSAADRALSRIGAFLQDRIS